MYIVIFRRIHGVNCYIAKIFAVTYSEYRNISPAQILRDRWVLYILLEVEQEPRHSIYGDICHNGKSIPSETR